MKNNEKNYKGTAMLSLTQPMSEMRQIMRKPETGIRNIYIFLP